MKKVGLMSWKVHVVGIIVSEIALQVATGRIIYIVWNVVDPFDILGNSGNEAVERNKNAWGATAAKC
jgi:hypothetical protein